MTCPHCQAAHTTFGPKAAAADRKRYLRRGPDQTTAEIVRAVRGLGLRGATLLDIGAGIGVVHHELLDEGIAAAVHVDTATAYLETARLEAALLARSAAKCRAAYALSYPRDRWYVRFVVRVQNLVRRLRRDAFRTFVHPQAAIRQVLADAGLRPAGGRDFFVWRVEWYRR